MANSCYTIPMMEGAIRVKHSFAPYFYIWAGKRLNAARADGTRRQRIIPYVIGDMIAAISLGRQFLFIAEQFGFTHDGLSIQGVIYSGDEINVLREFLKSDTIIVSEQITEEADSDLYIPRGWITRREIINRGLPSKIFGPDGINIDKTILKPLSELEASIESGQIHTQEEEHDEHWWDR